MSTPKAFPAVEGIRAIFNLWIVALHQHMFQKFFLGVYGKIPQLEYLSGTVWSGVALGNGYQVDVFFALSGLLFTWGLLQPGKTKSFIGLVTSLVLFVVKRILRLWPVLITVLALAFAVKDYGASNFFELAAQLTIPNYRDDMPQAAVPGWSNRVDIETCIVLFLIITTLRSLNLLNRFSSLLLIAASLVPKAWRFLSAPNTFSYMILGSDVMTTAIMIPKIRGEYYRDVLFKAANHTFTGLHPAERMTPMFFEEYSVTHQRWSPLFVGSAVAVALFSAYQQANKPRIEKPSTFQLILNVLSRLFSFMLLLISIVLAAMPILMSLSPPTAEIRATILANPPLEADFVISVLGRTLNACGWGYLLYRCLLPAGHPLRLNLLSAFLGNPVFQFVGKHSYCIYMLHYMVMHFVTFNLLTPARPEFVGGDDNESLLRQFFVLLAITYSITFALSVVIVRFVEEPALLALQVQMKALERALIGGNDDKKKTI